MPESVGGEQVTVPSCAGRGLVTPSAGQAGGEDGKGWVSGRCEFEAAGGARGSFLSRRRNCRAPTSLGNSAPFPRAGGDIVGLARPHPAKSSVPVLLSGACQATSARACARGRVARTHSGPHLSPASLGWPFNSSGTQKGWSDPQG